MHAVPAAELREGDWFWHEPWTGHRTALLQVATVLVDDTSVLIRTTDAKRELVTYRPHRPIQLAPPQEVPDHRPDISLDSPITASPPATRSTRHPDPPQRLSI
ncbi:hypothetical protein [Amycolatopsis sp. lyj-90]|uniref:hypothetical protein n=1 Tax=Amycolatopsis sp. lyj-90 TaxID=2789285 RepID=UPI003977F475